MKRFHDAISQALDELDELAGAEQPPVHSQLSTDLFLESVEYRRAYADFQLGASPSIAEIGKIKNTLLMDYCRAVQRSKRRLSSGEDWQELYEDLNRLKTAIYGDPGLREAMQEELRTGKHQKSDGLVWHADRPPQLAAAHDAAPAAAVRGQRRPAGRRDH
jgi:hypothetical protein